MLTCTKCKQEKPATTEFFPIHKGKKSGLDSWCRACRSSYRSSIRRGKYRTMIDDASLKALLSSASSCTICGIETNLVVDHDHKGQFIRGLLCNKCNKGIGLFQDDPDLLEFARIYILSSRGDPAADEYIKTHLGISCEAV